MAEIVKIKKDGVIQYPITKPECVIDENGKNVLQLIKENGGGGSTPDLSGYLTKEEFNEASEGFATADALAGKQDKIEDLNSIRSGAGKGATAVQPSVLEDYATTQQLTELSAEVGKKQDTISDLETIRSGAEKGATAIQEVKTINGQSIVGSGNIDIQGGGGTSNEWKCVADRRMVEGEKILEFTTYADGTPLKATEVMVQLLNDKKPAQNITGYVGIKSTNNQNEAIFGPLTYENSNLPEGEQRLQQLRICASPFFFSSAELRADIRCNTASVTTVQAQGGNLKTFQIYEDIVYVRIAPNAVLTSTAPYLKVYAR